MAKATAPDTTALSVSEAATAIVALINSRSQSPWPHEIEAIIAKVAPAEAPHCMFPNWGTRSERPSRVSTRPSARHRARMPPTQ